jgi:cell division protein FtsQ
MTTARTDDAAATPSGTTRPRWQRRVLLGLAVLGVTTVGTATWWGAGLLSRLAFFHVRTVQFEGVRYAKVPELMERLQEDSLQSVWQPLPILTARLANHPMLRHVVVTRELPGTLVVTVQEREPVALIPWADTLRPVDVAGVILPIDVATVALDVPVVSASEPTVLSVLDGMRVGAPALYRRVAEARLVGTDELRFTMTGSPVGASGPAMANTLVVRTTNEVTVARFRDILPVEADLARNHLRAVELDLRFRDQVIARQP